MSNSAIIQVLMSTPSAPAPHHWWQGASGRWWITTIFPLTIPSFSAGCVYVMARRMPDGQRVPMYIGQTEDSRERMREHLSNKMLLAAVLGANELHLHFLATTKDQRLAVETDLRNGHLTALNSQSTGLASLAQRI